VVWSVPRRSHDWASLASRPGKSRKSYIIFEVDLQREPSVGSDINNYTSPTSLETYRKNFTAAITELYPTFMEPRFARFMPRDNLPYNAEVKPIASPTFATETTLKFTFLCTKCITGNEFTAAFQNGGSFGFAAAQVAPPNAADPNGRLQYHFEISGVKQLDLTRAKSPNFGKITVLASSDQAHKIDILALKYIVGQSHVSLLANTSLCIKFIGTVPETDLEPYPEENPLLLFDCETRICRLLLLKSIYPSISISQCTATCTNFKPRCGLRSLLPLSVPVLEPFHFFCLI
jgi:hypothetical protein